MLLLTALATPSRAAAVDPDPWFGPDKALHFGATAALAIGCYTGAAFLWDDAPRRLAVGGGLALGAGIAKELFDLAGRGDASWRDLTWDVIGTVTGLLIAWTVDWLFLQPGHPPKTSAQASGDSRLRELRGPLLLGPPVAVVHVLGGL